MTANQLRYQELQELKRSNQEKENETNRSNLAREAETYRANTAKERETNRSNVMNEILKERQQDFDANELFASIGYLMPAEEWIQGKKGISSTSTETQIFDVKQPDTSHGGGGGGTRAR